MYSLKLTVGLKKCQKFKTALPHCTYNAVFCKVQTRLKCNFSEFNKRYNYLQTRSLKKKTGEISNRDDSEHLSSLDVDQF